MTIPMAASSLGLMLGVFLLIGAEGGDQQCSKGTVEALEGIYSGLKGDSSEAWKCGWPGKVCDQPEWVLTEGRRGNVKGLAWSGELSDQSYH